MIYIKCLSSIGVLIAMVKINHKNVDFGSSNIFKFFILYAVSIPETSVSFIIAITPMLKKAFKNWISDEI